MDDLGMMSEVVQRWVLRLEYYPDRYPRWREDSLTTIVGMLEDLGYGDKFPVIALAKKEETVYTTDGRVADGQTWKNDNTCSEMRPTDSSIITIENDDRRVLEKPIGECGWTWSEENPDSLEILWRMQQMSMQVKMSYRPLGIGPELARRIVESFRRN